MPDDQHSPSCTGCQILGLIARLTAAEEVITEAHEHLRNNHRMGALTVLATYIPTTPVTPESETPNA